MRDERHLVVDATTAADAADAANELITEFLRLTGLSESSPDAEKTQVALEKMLAK